MLFAEKDSLLTHLVSHKYEKSYLSTLLHFELRVLTLVHHLTPNVRQKEKLLANFEDSHSNSPFKT